MPLISRSVFAAILAILAGFPCISAAQAPGEIIIYRTNIMGLALQPKVFINGVPTGKCAAGQKFSVSVKPGVHKISGKTIQEKAMKVSVGSGQRIHIACSIGVGLIAGSIQLKLIPESEAAKKLSKLKNKGKHTVSSGQATVDSSASDTTTQTSATYTTKRKKKRKNRNCIGQVWDANLTKYVCPD